MLSKWNLQKPDSNKFGTNFFFKGRLKRLSYASSGFAFYLALGLGFLDLTNLGIPFSCTSAWLPTRWGPNRIGLFLFLSLIPVSFCGGKQVGCCL